jgi:hypothetical protein
MLARLAIVAIAVVLTLGPLSIAFAPNAQAAPAGLADAKAP